MLLAITCLGAVGCALPVVSLAPTDAAIRLRFAPADQPCFLVHVGYSELRFTIDPMADEQVVAVAPDGTRFHTTWSPGFRGGTTTDPVVLDPAGQVVARDGEVLAIPGQGWPTLHGYRVCASGDSIYVFLSGPV